MLSFELTVADAQRVLAALRTHVRHYQAHAAEDVSGAHDIEKQDSFRREYGVLIWRLEAALAPPCARIIHNDLAIDPRSLET